MGQVLHVVEDRQSPWQISGYRFAAQAKRIGTAKLTGEIPRLMSQRMTSLISDSMLHSYICWQLASEKEYFD